MSESRQVNRTYLSKLRRTWWFKHGYYQRYMLREATVLPLLFFCGCLLTGLYSLQHSEQSWLNWLVFMAKPWVIGLNLLTLLASLYHAKTFFELFPRVLPILPAPLMIVGQWLGTLTVALLLVLLLGGAL